MQLLEKGRNVVAAARDVSKAQEVFKELGLSEGINKGFGTVRSGPCISSTTSCMSLLRLPSAIGVPLMHTLVQPRSDMALGMLYASLRISSHPTRHARELQSFMGPLIIPFHSGLASQIILNAAGRAAEKVADEVVQAPSRMQSQYRHVAGQGTSQCCLYARRVTVQGILAIEGGIDITNPATLEAQLWRGVSQVVCVVGPVFGRTADGNMG